MKYRKKSVVADAEQWFKNGDHSLDGNPSTEGEVVRYFRDPFYKWDERGCEYCGQSMYEHGWIDTEKGGYRICPSDWIIREAKGEFYSCKDDIFRATYEPVENE